MIHSCQQLGEQVRKTRKEMGLSQQELADSVGVSRSWVSQFEGGKPSVEFDIVLRVLHRLQLRFDLKSVDANSRISLSEIIEDHKE